MNERELTDEQVIAILSERCVTYGPYDVRPLVRHVWSRAWQAALEAREPVVAYLYCSPSGRVQAAVPANERWARKDHNWNEWALCAMPRWSDPGPLCKRWPDCNCQDWRDCHRNEQPARQAAERDEGDEGDEVADALSARLRQEAAIWTDKPFYQLMLNAADRIEQLQHELSDERISRTEWAKEVEREIAAWSGKLKDAQRELSDRDAENRTLRETAERLQREREPVPREPTEAMKNAALDVPYIGDCMTAEEFTVIYRAMYDAARRELEP